MIFSSSGFFVPKLLVKTELAQPPPPPQVILTTPFTRRCLSCAQTVTRGNWASCRYTNCPKNWTDVSKFKTP